MARTFNVDLGAIILQETVAWSQIVLFDVRKANSYPLDAVHSRSSLVLQRRAAVFIRAQYSDPVRVIIDQGVNRDPRTRVSKTIHQVPRIEVRIAFSL